MTRAWLLAGPVPRGVEVVGVGPAGQLIFDVSEPFNVDEEFNSDYVVRAELSPDSTSVKNLNIGAGDQKDTDDTDSDNCEESAGTPAVDIDWIKVLISLYATRLAG